MTISCVFEEGQPLRDGFVNVYSSRYNQFYGHCAPERVRSGMAKYRLRIRVWRQHNGKSCPVPGDTVVRVKLRNGEILPPRRSIRLCWWRMRGILGPHSIVAYQILQG